MYPCSVSSVLTLNSTTRGTSGDIERVTLSDNPDAFANEFRYLRGENIMSFI